MRQSKLPPENVHDYPRPPLIEEIPNQLTVIVSGKTIASSTDAFRICETTHPPCYYIPVKDIDMHCLTQNSRVSFCEFKGSAKYWDYRIDDQFIENIAWSYPSPTKSYRAITNYLSFYASKCDECRVDDEIVQAQQGDFYGGWITANLLGPFKGPRGTEGW